MQPETKGLFSIYRHTLVSSILYRTTVNQHFPELVLSCGRCIKMLRLWILRDFGRKIWLRHLENMRCCKRLVYCVAKPLHTPHYDWNASLTAQLHVWTAGWTTTARCSKATWHQQITLKIWPSSGYLCLLLYSSLIHTDFLLTYKLRLITLLVFPKVKQLCSQFIQIYWSH